MKYAIIYVGPYRGTSDILNNHITTFGSNIDMYVSCFEHYLEDWKKSGWPIKEYFITPYIDFNQTNWSKYRNNAAGQSGFWQFWNLRSVINYVPKNYDFYIKNRNDLIFNTQFDIDFNQIESNDIFSPNESFHKKDWNPNTWINDEFYIGSYKVMNIISNFSTNYYNNPNRHKLNEARVGGVGSNENSLRNFLVENGINIKKLHGFTYSKNNNGINVPSGISGFQLEKI
jgi:hypothetical protein